MDELLGHRFSVIEGIYHPSPLMNVIWALNRAQEPLRFPERNPVIASSVRQIESCPMTSTSVLTIVSSSYGSVVAGQVGCYLAERHRNERIFSQPFNIALGASMISERSGLFKKLHHYQDLGIINKIIYHELQDQGDNSNGIGGVSKLEAYANGLGICFPFFSPKHKGPSFLNSHPEKGHLHRVRAQSVQKARDFRKVLLDDFGLEGDV